MNSKHVLRYAALAEAITLSTLICIAVPLKYVAGYPVATSIAGPVHGAVFSLFVWICVRSWAEGIIDGKGIVRLFIGAMIPFAGFFNERWLRRHFEMGKV